MPLTSYVFFGFLAFITVVYFLIPKRWQWVLLLAGSYVFYLYSDVRLVGYILFSTLTSFYGAQLVRKQNDKLPEKKSTIPEDEALRARIVRRRKLIMAAVLVGNFGILAYFKHLDAWISYLNAFFGVTGLDFTFDQVSLILPLGISFYTFQSMGYLIDVYREKIEPDRNLAKFALFVSFFPQLIQGPISRYDELAHQLHAPHSFDYTRVKQGILLMFWGLFKKLVIADRIAIITGGILHLDGRADVAQHPTGVWVVLLGVFYSLQIYADFSGGVDIARGAAQILGIDLPHNFLRPYFATSLPEYWRRWHITLNNWWRDYIFYPVVFSNFFKKVGRYYRKKGKNQTAKLLPVYAATMIVRVINAMWHGASVKYLANGLYNGTLIILGMQLHPLFMKWAKALHINTETQSFQVFRMLRTFVLVSVARLVTVAPRFLVSCAMLLSVTDLTTHPFSLQGFFDITFPWIVWGVLILAIAVWFASDVLNERGVIVRDWLEKQNLPFQWILILALIFSVLIFGVYGPEVDASMFIYQQF